MCRSERRRRRRRSQPAAEAHRHSSCRQKKLGREGRGREREESTHPDPVSQSLLEPEGRKRGFVGNREKRREERIWVMKTRKMKSDVEWKEEEEVAEGDGEGEAVLTEEKGCP